jgi:hypothetical protein
VKSKDGVVTIRYPRRLLGLGEKQGQAVVALSVAIPWRMVIQGGAAEVGAELGGLNLAGLEIKGGFSMICLNLPAPSGVVPIRIMGEHQKSPCAVLQASPPASTSRAGSPNWSSTIKPSAVRIITCDCKALVLIRPPRTMTSRSQAMPTESPSPPVDDGSLAPTCLSSQKLLFGTFCESSHEEMNWLCNQPSSRKVRENTQNLTHILTVFFS